MTSCNTLIDKYRPASLVDLVLPTQHTLHAALQYLGNPYSSAWLLYGRPGLGKSSLAKIMAAAAGDPLSTSTYVGSDLSVEVVRQLASAYAQRPLFGKFHCLVVDEADVIPRLAQVRLLGLLENLQHCVAIFTSNDSLEEFEGRFVSRVKPQLFTCQGLHAPGTEWLLRIAQRESIELSRHDAARIVKDSKSNLRACLQTLEILGAEQSSRRGSSLPVITATDRPTNKVGAAATIC